MQVFKEAVAVLMHPEERDELLAHIGLVWDHLSDHFKGKEVETGTPDAKLMDAMSAIEALHRRLSGGKFA